MEANTIVIIAVTLALVGVLTFLWFTTMNKEYSNTTRGITMVAAILLLVAFVASLYMYVPR